MDIEDLSKSQLLLLTILVNFVVSIATGILTVSLLDQAPTTVTQTVNRIVDHTIETVTTQVPVIGSNDSAVPSSEELLTAAISTNAAHQVRIYRRGVAAPLAIGIYFPDARRVVTVSDDLPGHVSITFPDGSTVEADRTKEDGRMEIFAFPEDATLPSAASFPLAAVADVKQGQTLIGFTAEGGAVTGIVSRVDGEGLHADLTTIPSGGGIVNLSGVVIGISAGGGLFYPADRIGAALAP